MKLWLNSIFILFGLLSIASSLQAQCDTVPKPNFFPFFKLDGSGLTFAPGNRNAPATVTLSDRPSAWTTNRTIVLANLDGSPKLYFDGSRLYNNEFVPLAGGDRLGLYDRFSQTRGASYSQAVILEDKNPDFLHIFYGKVQESNISLIDPNQPAWYARYSSSLDSFIVRDSVLYNQHINGWSTVKASDEESWWVISQAHSPQRFFSFLLTANGIQSPVISNSNYSNAKVPTNLPTVSINSFSQDGNHFIVRNRYTDTLTDGFNGINYSLEYFSFSCSNGMFTNQKVLDNFRTNDAISNFSKSGRYLYHGMQRPVQAPYLSDSLFRYDLYETSPRAIFIANNAAESILYGPDGRMYTVGGTDRNQVGYLKFPDRWLPTPGRPNGLKWTSYGIGWDQVEVGFQLHQMPRDLPELRTPTALGPNVISCTDTATFTINENCFYNAAGITLSLGPGIELVNRVDADFQLAFDPDSTISPIRYIALANEHPCRTYRDTVWMFVENCDGGCQPLQTSEAVAACDSSLVHGLWQDASGTYPQTFNSIAGCDSTSVVQLIINESVQTAASVNACDSVQLDGEWITEDGDYPTVLTTTAGCDSTHVTSVSLQATPPILQLPSDTTLATQALLEINADSLDQYPFLWMPPSAVDCADCPSIAVVAGFAGRLQVDIGEQPCISSAQIDIERQDKIMEAFSAPDAFSPNGDGINDFFEIALPTGAELLSFVIYNRWGTQVYESTCPCTVNQFGLLATWDGNERGTPVNPGGFAYLGEIRYADGREELVEGSLILVR